MQQQMHFRCSLITAQSEAWLSEIVLTIGDQLYLGVPGNSSPVYSNNTLLIDVMNQHLFLYLTPNRCLRINSNQFARLSSAVRRTGRNVVKVPSIENQGLAQQIGQEKGTDCMDRIFMIHCGTLDHTHECALTVTSDADWACFRVLQLKQTFSTSLHEFSLRNCIQFSNINASVTFRVEYNGEEDHTFYFWKKSVYFEYKQIYKYLRNKLDLIQNGRPLLAEKVEQAHSDKQNQNQQLQETIHDQSIPRKVQQQSDLIHDYPFPMEVQQPFPVSRNTMGTKLQSNSDVISSQGLSDSPDMTSSPSLFDSPTKQSSDNEILETATPTKHLKSHHDLIKEQQRQWIHSQPALNPLYRTNMRQFVSISAPGPRKQSQMLTEITVGTKLRFDDESVKVTNQEHQTDKDISIDIVLESMQMLEESQQDRSNSSNMTITEAELSQHSQYNIPLQQPASGCNQNNEQHAQDGYCLNGVLSDMGHYRVLRTSRFFNFPTCIQDTNSGDLMATNAQMKCKMGDCIIDCVSSSESKKFPFCKLRMHRLKQVSAAFSPNPQNLCIGEVVDSMDLTCLRNRELLQLYPHKLVALEQDESVACNLTSSSCIAKIKFDQQSHDCCDKIELYEVGEPAMDICQFRCADILGVHANQTFLIDTRTAGKTSLHKYRVPVGFRKVAAPKGGYCQQNQPSCFVTEAVDGFVRMFDIRHPQAALNKIRVIEPSNIHSLSLDNSGNHIICGYETLATIVPCRDQKGSWMLESRSYRKNRQRPYQILTSKQLNSGHHLSHVQFMGSSSNVMALQNRSRLVVSSLDQSIELAIQFGGPQNNRIYYLNYESVNHRLQVGINGSYMSYDLEM